MTNVDPDQMPRYVTSDLGLHRLHKPVFPQYLGLLWYIYIFLTSYL